MSVEQDLSIEQIYMKLLNEGTDVWRPICATSLGNGLFRISEQDVPEDEEWEFAPGSIVSVIELIREDGDFLVCTSAEKSNRI